MNTINDYDWGVVTRPDVEQALLMIPTWVDRFDPNGTISEVQAWNVAFHSLRSSARKWDPALMPWLTWAGNGVRVALDRAVEHGDVTHGSETVFLIVEDLQDRYDLAGVAA